MLPQARVANVKGAGMNARLASAIEHGARGFDDQDTALNARARLTLAIDLAAKQLRGQNKLFNPDQPRDDHGRWTGDEQSVQNSQAANTKDNCIEECLHFIEFPHPNWSEDIRTNKFNVCANACMSRA